MTHQMEHQPLTIETSLGTKLRDLVAGLTAEEEVQLHSMRVESGAADLSPSLRAKLQQAADRLTPEERSQVRDLVRRAAVDPMLGIEADTTGHAVAVYEDEYGYKGRPGTNPAYMAQGGVSLPNLGFVLLSFAGAVWHANVIVNGPEYEP
jgi:hypothetical protein